MTQEQIRKQKEQVRTYKDQLEKRVGLTKKQREFLDYLENYSEEFGYAPSQQEMAAHFGFSSLGTVQNYLVRLERHGFLRKTWNARHGIEVIGSPKMEAIPASAILPLVGRVAAGAPIEAIDQDQQQHVEVPATMLKQGEHFVLQVFGDSMIEDGILENDLAIIRKQATAHNGQTVVALLDNAATIKKYYNYADRVELHPANPAYAPIVVQQTEPHDFKIEGVLVGVIRNLD